MLCWGVVSLTWRLISWHCKSWVGVRSFITIVHTSECCSAEINLCGTAEPPRQQDSRDVRPSVFAGARERNVKKASLVYDTIANSNGFYFSPVEESVRSKMNVPFTIPSKPELEKTFVAEATAAKLLELKGHRSVGGMRASIYNAMPYEGVEKLSSFMKEFQSKNA